MKVSFLVTYYNQKECVAQSLESILRIEKPCDWEILVGDDGSDDGTVEVVREYMARYPEHIFLYVMDREPGKKYEIVRRASANRLNLIDHMTGSCFCFLDGDDFYCDTEFISRALTLFSENPELSTVAFGYQMFSDSAGVVSSHTLPEGHINTETYLRTGLYTHAGACVFKNHMDEERKEFLRNVGYYDDNDILVNNLHFGTMYGVSKVIYSYRQTENSTYNAMDFAERAVLNAQGYDVDRLLLADLDDALMDRCHVALLQVYFLQGRLKKLLGKEKWERYLQGCRQIPQSLTCQLLLGRSALTKQGRERLRSLRRLHPKSTVRQFLRCSTIR